ncbi:MULTISPECIES: DUF2271 domain-containing protein [Novosphingobium]|jgi:hypothetical protein|uniref:Periplasmic-like protein n=1 Tax=Novosphingobium resinovorum TaxID=158500 RepID=A0A031K2U9_9SPHN|nr:MULTISPECIES: DUF2271 domain-containing protein [Novosphingobium]EZP84286.1 Periplasmic-like protein [Novosphingobium resinovorum]GLK43404.1 hypothetical protein GCM10017612_13230 [Novosphingobium resinovorum]
MTRSKILPALPLLAAGTATALAATPALAASVTVTVPQIKVAEYHRPYVAGWVEPVAGGDARTLFVWFDGKKRGAEPGTKWLADLRTWWRKGGRSLKLPADGISGATRAPGSYTVAIPANLPKGDYVLKVEAARETGGRELVSVPFTVGGKGGSVSGKTELGTVTVR